MAVSIKTTTGQMYGFEVLPAACLKFSNSPGNNLRSRALGMATLQNQRGLVQKEPPLICGDFQTVANKHEVILTCPLAIYYPSIPELRQDL